MAPQARPFTGRCEQRFPVVFRLPLLTFRASVGRVRNTPWDAGVSVIFAQPDGLRSTTIVPDDIIRRGKHLCARTCFGHLWMRPRGGICRVKGRVSIVHTYGGETTGCNASCRARAYRSCRARAYKTANFFFSLVGHGPTRPLASLHLVFRKYSGL